MHFKSIINCIHLPSRRLSVFGLILASTFSLLSCGEDGPSGPVPIIQSFSPVSGEVGATVTITGSNFSESSAEVEVYFNGVSGEVMSSTLTQIFVEVPEGATTGRITVKTKGVPGASAEDFKVVVNPWVLKKSLAYNLGREDAVGFSVGNKGYIGLGSATFGPDYKDLWMYDPSTDTWAQKADFGGEARSGAVSMVIGDKAYVGTGTGQGSELKDFWEYDPAQNKWTQKADFAGVARDHAASFVIGDKGYIGCGYYPALKDFWEYSPSTNTWTQKKDFPGTARYDAVGFSINSKGYIGTGYSGGTGEKDFWEYAPASDTWTKKADFGGSTRFSAVAFVVNGFAYVGTGYLIGWGNEGERDFWKYDSAADAWTRVTDFFGGKYYGHDYGQRGRAVAFTIGSKAYVGTGDGALFDNTDFWEYTPE